MLSWKNIFEDVKKSWLTCLSTGSTPTVGSSSINNSGSWISAAARLMRLCCPPLSSFTSLFWPRNRIINSRICYFVLFFFLPWRIWKLKQFKKEIRLLINIFSLHSVNPAEVDKCFSNCKFAIQSELLRHVTNAWARNATSFWSRSSTEHPDLSWIQASSSDDAWQQCCLSTTWSSQQSVSRNIFNI